MKHDDIKITHIFHSSFVVEFWDKILIFDYFKNPLLKFNFEELFYSNKDVYVFVSHSHSDHYNPEIFNWESKSSDIKYILSYDIKIESNKDNYFFMNNYESMMLDDIEIKTYGTTDLGVSFLITIGDTTIFHGGDLNWWHWKKDDVTTQKKEELDFKAEVDKLIGQKIDIAFIPVDPRLEEFYYLAGEYVIKTLKPKLLVPMHFANNYYITNEFKDKIKSSSTNVQVISKDKLSFVYK